jgi:hypothetical protein
MVKNFYFPTTFCYFRYRIKKSFQFRGDATTQMDNCDDDHLNIFFLSFFVKEVLKL